MRRIFTSTIFVAAILVASFNSFAQDCATSQPNPSVCSGSVADNFSSGNGGFSSSGTTAFTLSSGTWSATTSGNGGTNTSIMTSSGYVKTATLPNAVTAGFAASAGNKITITSVKLDVLNSSDVVIASCSQTLNLSGGSTTVCISIFSAAIQTGTMIKYRFTVNTSNGNGAGSRTITFDDFSYGGLSNAPLPVKFQTLDARTLNNSVSLKWDVATEENLSGYSIERSTDGRSFSQIAFVSASGESNYSFVDSKPLSVSYYRIKSVDLNGRYGYSTVALVKSGKSSIVLKAFPTPFIKNVSIQHPTAIAGNSITISSSDGRVIKTIIPAAGAQQTDVDLSSAKSGLYLVRFNGANGESETLKLLKQ